jgi:hypothetical protein
MFVRDKWMNMHYWLSDTDKAKPKDSENILSQCHFVHRIFLVECPGIEHGFHAVRGRRITIWAIAQP